MSDDTTARVTLRGEFLRAERHLARAVSAERKIAAVEAELFALDALSTPEVTPSEDMRAAFRLAARAVRAALEVSS